ncbi:NADPH-dependent 7-cyano-7-deazaguanine reductase QueF [Motiliproteus sp. SC1-56]|uniref:NADPH-dependent 7-cyano-7-deazaguanine reductase QueF n=1 Tax=Motiliproteus sp. SC1-56 TaxID=2799565 RepID=UPI001A8EC2DD|nr:NADPH-dependent 7-cyano-7-deazaguanine reductase QueF [Motiliproteus sp. SC1-56]
MSHHHEHLKHSPLGQTSDYVAHYDPSLLCPIPRASSWRERGYSQAPFQGVDLWNAYELSWLSPRGLPRVAMAEFSVPCDSPNIIESKSFKLYLNSFNQTALEGPEELRERLVRDLTACAGAPVGVVLRSVDDVDAFGLLTGECLDDRDIAINHYQPAPELLRTRDEKPVEEQLFSHLLKSNCPVTGQPDWASVQIEYRGAPIDRDGLLAYLVSYREHGDFHEQCVERIFLDILEHCQPQRLRVYARYLRRGGLDINPLRSTEAVEVTNPRLSRQ